MNLNFLPNRIRTTVLLLLVTFATFTAVAQPASTYSFQAFTGTYTPNSGGTATGSGFMVDDGAQQNIPIGFTFNFCGTNYTTLSANSDGYLSLANSSYTYYPATAGTFAFQYINEFAPNPVSSGGNYTGGLLMWLWADLYGASGQSTPAPSSTYVTTGTAPNRVFTLELQNCEYWNNYVPILNIEIKLFEGTNVIQYIYNQITPFTYSYCCNGIGIANSQVDYKFLTNSSTSPGTTTSSVPYFGTVPGTSSATAQIYQFAPPAPCSGTPLSPSITTVLSGPVCSGNSATLSLYDPNITTGIYYVWQTGPSSVGPWTNIPGAASATSYTTPALIATSYYRVGDSCANSGQVSYSSGFTVPVNTYSIPYAEYFNTTLTTYLPFCFTNNISGTGSKWYAISNGSFHDATGVGYPSLVVEDDVVGNSSGKNAFFTLPAIPLSAGATYRIRFGYERGRDNPTANTGLTYTENLQLFENYGVQPSTAAPGSPGGTNLFNTNVTTDGHNQASLTYTAGASGAYFFSWYSLTPHPSAGILVPGGYIGVDSIRIDSIGCNLPVITFQPQNSAVCLNNPVTLSVTATGYGLTYQWYKNGGAITGATNSTYTIPNAQGADAGVYKVAVTGTCGGTTIIQSNTVSLAVSNYPTDTITTTTPIAFCAGGNVVLTANAVGGSSYQWKVNGNFIPNAFGATYTATTAGSYQSVVTNPTGCATTSPAIPVSVLSASSVTVSPSGPTTFCNGGSVTLTGNYTMNNGITYQWYVNNNPISGANQYFYTTGTAGSYTLQEMGGNGCTVQFPNPINVVVNGPTAPPLLSANGPLSFCLGGYVTLCTPDLSQPGYTYQWYQNGNPITGQTNTCYTASATGIYNVNVIQNNCALSSVVDTITVDAPPTTVSNNGTIICSGNTIVLTAPAGAGLHYQWKMNGTNVAAPAGVQQVLYDTVAGAFQVQVTDSPANCVAVSSVTSVSVGAPPVATILATGPTTFCPGGSVTIKANSTDTSLNYTWNVSPTGLPGTYVTLPPTAGAPYTPYGHHDSVRTFNTSGYYTVTEANGPCVSTSSAIQVIVSPVPTPVITPSGSTSLCPGGSVTLNTQAGTSQTYQWIYNGSPVASGITSSLLVNSAGTYKVSVTNGTGCTGASLPVTVSAYSFPPDSIFTFGSDTICANATTTLIASTCAGCTYQWKLNGSPAPTVQGANNLQSYVADAAGNYVVSVTSAQGCVATTPTPTTLTVLPVPSSNVFALSSTTFCQGGSVVLSAGSGSGLTYQWQGGPVVNNYPNISGATSSTYTDSVSGYYRVIISNGACAVSSVVIPVTVNVAPTVTITPSGATSICAGNSVLLTATNLSGVTYQWKLNNNNIPNANNSFFTASNSGNYTVVASGNNCTSTSVAQQVTVNALPVAVVTLDPNSTPESRNPICAGTPASLIDVNAYPAIPGFSYVWSKNGGAAPNTNTNANYLATDSGLYTVAIKDTNGCVGVSLPYLLGEVPIPHPVVLRPGSGSVLSTGTFQSYQWYFNGNPITGDTTNSITIYGPGNYKVEVKDKNGCPGTSDELYVGNVGVKNVNNNIDVNIYPNPATTIVHIDAPVKVNVSVSGLDGKVILRENSATQIDLSQLANGVYMITVYDQDNNTLKVDKLVKTAQ